MNIHKYMQLSEVEKINISRNLIDKIYVNIAEKYNTIDFETIPASNGKIIKMKEYANLKESIELMKSIAKDSKQTIPEIDVLNTAITNIERFQDIFYMGFVNKNASVILMYNILTLSVYCGTSLMISVLVDYINMGNTDTVQLIINKKYNKKGSYLLIESLKKFNETVKNGSFMKMIDASYNKNDQLNESVTFTVLTIVAAIVAVFAIVPLTKELIFLFYYTRMRLSEAAELQAKLIDA
ncbi:MAG: hypothetical protein KGZ74_04930, partial [Chitinophagaceae bacterium]|nr:hypothetical protein [Chitinophagaceae bacterium]